MSYLSRSHTDPANERKCWDINGNVAQGGKGGQDETVGRDVRGQQRAPDCQPRSVVLWGWAPSESCSRQAIEDMEGERMSGLIIKHRKQTSWRRPIALGPGDARLRVRIWNGSHTPSQDVVVGHNITQSLMLSTPPQRLCQSIKGSFFRETLTHQPAGARLLERLGSYATPLCFAAYVFLSQNSFCQQIQLICHIQGSAWKSAVVKKKLKGNLFLYL